MSSIEHAGNIVHNGNMNELLGFSDNVKNSINVWRSTLWTQRWRRTLENAQK